MVTARMETICGPTPSMARAIGGYHMAKRFHVSMPLFTLPLTVEVTHRLVQNAYIVCQLRFQNVVVDLYLSRLMSLSIYICQD